MGVLLFKGLTAVVGDAGKGCSQAAGGAVRLIRSAIFETKVENLRRIGTGTGCNCANEAAVTDMPL